MFGISRKEIEKRISDKIISELRDKGSVHLENVGTLFWTSGDEKIRFQQDPHLRGKLEQRSL